MSDVSRGFCKLLGLFQDSSNVSPYNDIALGFLKIDQKMRYIEKIYHFEYTKSSTSSSFFFRFDHLFFVMSESLHL